MQCYFSMGILCCCSSVADSVLKQTQLFQPYLEDSRGQVLYTNKHPLYDHIYLLLYSGVRSEQLSASFGLQSIIAVHIHYT